MARRDEGASGITQRDRVRTDMMVTRDGAMVDPSGNVVGLTATQVAATQALVSDAGIGRGIEYVFIVGDSHPNGGFYTDGASPDGLSPSAYFVAGAANNNSRSWGFPSWLEAVSLGKIVVLGSFARQTNGFLTAGVTPAGVPISVQITQAMAHPLWPLVTKIICMGGFNDAAFSVSSVLSEFQTQRRRTGKPWVVASPPPRSDSAATTVGGDGMQGWAWSASLRLAFKRSADASGGLIRFVDTYALVNNPTATPDAWRSGWSYDTIHGNNAPGYVEAKGIFDELFPAGAGTNFELWRTAAWAGASGANGLIDQGFSNPTFATTTGGTVNTGSGNLPSGMTLSAIASGSAGAIVVAANDIPGGAGNMVTIPITSTASGDGIDITSSSVHAAGGTFVAPGDACFARLLLRVNGGGIYPRNLNFRLTAFNGSNFIQQQFELDVSKEIALPFSGSPVLLLRTPSFVMPAGAAALSSLTWRLRPTCAGAGAASISFCCPSIERIKSGASYA